MKLYQHFRRNSNKIQRVAFQHFRGVSSMQIDHHRTCPRSRVARIEDEVIIEPERGMRIFDRCTMLFFQLIVCLACLTGLSFAYFRCMREERCLR